jgi:predicted TIM-barrel fold metal-dependent hydrolase
MIFDCHAHIISDDIERYPIQPLSGTVRSGDLDDPVTAERLLRQLDAHGVERAVVVQRAHVYGFDNSYVVDAADAYPDRLRPLCMVDARAADAQAQVRHWVAERGSIGIRLTEPFKGADTSWFASPQALLIWETAAELRVPLRLHLFRWNRSACLPVIAQLLSRYPQLPVVIDHLSNLAAEDGPPDYGLDEPLRALIEFPQLHLLFSTINLAKLATAGIPAAPVIEHLVDAFGAQRIMWGSDIGQSRGGYGEMVAMANAAVSTLTADDREQVLVRTGRTVYG